MEIYEYTIQIMPRKKDVRMSQILVTDAEWMNTGLYRKDRAGNIIVIPYDDFGRVLRYEESYCYRLYLVRKDASYVRTAFKKFFRKNGLEEYRPMVDSAAIEDRGETPEENGFAKEELAAIRKHDKEALRARRDEED
ncbi:MAG: hypothetical protein IJH77_01360 [Mogibacterium sp.]|nr:hypothetical protein [Mogibacterium sp.]